jgi:hypothetical protein
LKKSILNKFVLGIKIMFIELAVHLLTRRKDEEGISGLSIG